MCNISRLFLTHHYQRFLSNVFNVIYFFHKMRFFLFLFITSTLLTSMIITAVCRMDAKSLLLILSTIYTLTNTLFPRLPDSDSIPVGHNPVPVAFVVHTASAYLVDSLHLAADLVLCLGVLITYLWETNESKYTISRLHWRTTRVYRYYFPSCFLLDKQVKTTQSTQTRNSTAIRSDEQRGLLMNAQHSSDSLELKSCGQLNRARKLRKKMN